MFRKASVRTQRSDLRDKCDLYGHERSQEWESHGANAIEIFPERVASTMYHEGQSLKWEGRETQFQAEGTARAKPKKWTESNTFEN